MTKENAVRELELRLSADEIRQKGLHQAAADEIERLREVNELLQEVVKLLKEQVNMQKEAINDTRKILRGET